MDKKYIYKRCLFDKNFMEQDLVPYRMDVNPYLAE